MVWFRVDVAIARNAKILALVSERDGYHAFAAYIFSIGYCKEQQTDGYIPKAGLPHIHARPRDADLLVKHRLWRANGTGWVVPDFAEYQPSAADEHAKGVSARKAACHRWHGPSCGCWEQDA